MKKQKKYYLIYQITNNLNHKIYIGKHKTDCPDDNYFGSGKHLRNAQEKYGLENFTKTILFYCANEEEMNLLEKMVVTPEFCAREDVYNINVGGDGGWNYVNNELHLNGNKMFTQNMTKADYKKRGQKSAEAKKRHIEEDPSFEIQVSNKISNSLKNTYAKNGSWWTGKHHTEETKCKLRGPRLQSMGEKNSQYGMIAIYNETTFERATQPKDQPIPEGWAKGRFYKATPEELIQRKKILDEILRLDPESKATIRMKLDQLERILKEFME